MSLTSYRTAPPRVTAVIAAGPEPEAILETTSRPSAQPADLAILTVSPNEPRLTPPGRREIRKGGPFPLARKGLLLAFGFADLAATYSPVP